MQLQQVFPGNLLVKDVIEANMKEKQVGMLQVFGLPPLLHIQSPSIIPGSVADYLVWLLLMLYTNFQGKVLRRFL